MTETSGRTKPRGKGERRSSIEKSGQHLLENSWWIYKELVYLVSYQMPHYSIFRSLRAGRFQTCEHPGSSRMESSINTHRARLRSSVLRSGNIPYSQQPWKPAAQSPEQPWTWSRATRCPSLAVSPRAMPRAGRKEAKTEDKRTGPEIGGEKAGAGHTAGRAEDAKRGLMLLLPEECSELLLQQGRAPGQEEPGEDRLRPPSGSSESAKPMKQEAGHHSEPSA